MEMNVGGGGEKKSAQNLQYRLQQMQNSQRMWNTSTLYDNKWSKM